MGDFVSFRNGAATYVCICIHIVLVDRDIGFRTGDIEPSEEQNLLMKEHEFNPYEKKELLVNSSRAKLGV